VATFILLVIVGAVVYFFATKRTRRDDAVEVRVQRMIAGGQSLVTFNELYFDAAKSYAISKGADATERDAASTTMLVGGRTFFVVFMRENRGGTTISISDDASIEREMMSFPSR
jgi:hypothetical protein